MSELRAFREALVLEHIEAENAHDLERVMRTFTQPRYDLRGAGRGVVEGDEAVRQLELGNFAALKGVVYVLERLYHSNDAVIVEYRITGKHEGTYRDIPPSGAALDCPAIAVFEFDNRALVCERPYVNQVTLEAQMRGRSLVGVHAEAP